MFLIYDKYLPFFQLDGLDFDGNKVKEYDNLIATGGRGSIKTGTGVRSILMHISKYQKRVCCGREVMASIEQSLYKEFVALIDKDEEFKTKGFWYDKRSIYHLNGSELFFRGFNDINVSHRESTKGLADVDIFLVDEAQNLTKDTLDVLLATARKDGSKYLFFYNRIENNLPIEEEMFIDYETMSCPDNTYFVEVNYTELLPFNILSKRFIERAEQVKKNKPKDYERIYLNKPPDQSDRAVVKYWSKDNIDERITYNEDLDVYITCDFNVDPMSWALLHKTDDKFFQFDELVIENFTTQDAINEIINRYPNHKANWIINGDASGNNRSTKSNKTDYIIIKNTLIREFGDKVRVEVRKANTVIKARVNAFNNAVLGDDGVRRYFVHPRCKWTIYNMKNLKYKEGTSIIDEPSFSKIKSDQESKFLGHIFDAVSYHVQYYKPIRYE